MVGERSFRVGVEGMAGVRWGSSNFGPGFGVCFGSGFFGSCFGFGVDMGIVRLSVGGDEKAEPGVLKRVFRCRLW